jgi:prepilin-type N-terminal cleavage/methylation domain-containing protein
MKLSIRRTAKGFTLAEVLAALAFMAIVIPVAVEGLRLASVAGQMGVRRTAAGQVAERVMNELLLNEKARGTTQSGVALEGVHEYRWSTRWETWPEDAISQVTVEVIFNLQGRDYDLQLTTLVDTSSST